MIKGFIFGVVSTLLFLILYSCLVASKEADEQIEKQMNDKNIKKGSLNMKTCENCINCMYLEHGDMYCDEHEDFAFVYDEFVPTEDYMWCKGKKYEKR